MSARVIAYLAQTWWGRILSEHDTEPTELSGGLLKLVLGVVLVAPFDTFGNSVAFRDLSLLPEWLFGMLFICIGIGHLAVLRNGSEYWRRQFAGIGAGVWLALSGIFLHAVPSSWAAWVFLLAGVWQCWCYVRLRGPVRSAAR